MMKKFKIAALMFSLLSLGACSSMSDLRYVRSHYSSEKQRAKVKDFSDKRAEQISEHNTLYGKKLQCLRDMHADFFNTVRQASLQSGMTTGNGYFRMAVAPLRDKTGKVFDANSTALSDMAMDAVSHFRHFDMVETPLGPDSLIDSRNSFLHPNYVLPNGVVQNFSATMTSLQQLPIGVNFPSNYYIAGALVQYDEINELPYNKDLGLDIHYFQHSRGLSAITVTVNMRLIDSWSGTVLRASDTGELVSVNLTNTFYTLKTGNNFYRMIGSRNYGIDYSVQVGDPKMAAVKEMVDKGVFMLLDKFLKPYQGEKPNC